MFNYGWQNKNLAEKNIFNENIISIEGKKSI